MEKLRKIIGYSLASAGLFVAICCMDGTPHEIAIRLSGVALFAIGAAIAPKTRKEAA